MSAPESTGTAAAGTLFGTDGVRGVANAEPVTPELALRLGEAIARADPAGRRRCVVVGRDTRLSGEMLENALCAGICAAGADALRVGVLPTPAIAYLTRLLGADAGAVISASHNPFADNGIKFFGSAGYKLSDDAEAAIEAAVRAPVASRRPTGAAIGRCRNADDAPVRYGDFLVATAGGAAALRGLTIVIDGAHGAGYRVGPEVLRACGARVSAIGVEPDGTNINDGVGALHPEVLQARVLAERADLGIALDGDGDRMILVDEQGAAVDGDEVLAMVAADMLQAGTLRQSTVVGTVMSNLGLAMALHERGARLVRVAVGDRHVVEEMRRHGYNLGGEPSGHLVFLDHATTGDGLLAGLIVARLLARRQQPMSALKRVMIRFPQTLINVRVARRAALESVSPVQAAIGRVRAALGERGRVLVRYSGTEPLVRVMVEGEEGAAVRGFAEEIAAAVRSQLGG